MAAELGDLIRRCLAADPRAQQALYEQFAPRVYRLAVRMVGKDHAADVTQQTFLQMFRGLAKYAGKAEFSTWLYRIAVNECLQHRRRERAPFKPLPSDLADGSTPQDLRFEQAELLGQALETLDEQLRAIFLLREVDELSYREIGEVMNLPAGTVASQLNRARAELRGYLSKVMSE